MIKAAHKFMKSRFGQMRRIFNELFLGFILSCRSAIANIECCGSEHRIFIALMMAMKSQQERGSHKQTRSCNNSCIMVMFSLHEVERMLEIY